MMFTILSARYANDDHSAAVIMTVEASAVLLSPADSPDEWAAMLRWGSPSAYAAPPPAVPLTISDRQFFQQLAMDEEITREEALAAVATGAVPAMLAGKIALLPSESQFAANMFLQGATTFERNHPMTLALAALVGWNSAGLDALWTSAAAL